MQDNPFDERFMDEAWGKMQVILQQEMPQEKKRRAFLWWWLFPVGIIGLGLGAFYLFGWNSLNLDQRQEPDTPIAQQEILKTEEEQDTPELAAITSPKESIPVETKSSTSASANSSVILNQVVPKIESQVTKESGDASSDSKQTSDPLIDYNPISKLESETVVGTQLSETSAPLKDETPPLDSPAGELTDLPGKETASVLNSSFFLDPLQIGIAFDYESKIKEVSPSIPALKVLKPRKNTFWAESLLANESTFTEAPDLGLGMSWQRKWGRKYLRIGLLYYRGQMNLGPQMGGARSVNDFASQENTPTLDPDSSFGLNADQSIGNIPAQYQALSLPVHFGYVLSKKWSVEGGLQLSRAIQFKSQNSLNESLQQDFVQRLDSYDTSNNQNLGELLEQKTFMEAQLGMNYHLASRWQLSAQYQFGKNDLTRLEDYSWNRNQVKLGLRYRIN